MNVWTLKVCPLLRAFPFVRSVFVYLLYTVISAVLLMCLCRLVKGDGEIVEEIVSKDRQKAINKVSLARFVLIFHLGFFLSISTASNYGRCNVVPTRS